MVSQTFAQQILNLLTGKTNTVTYGTMYIGLSTTVPSINTSTGAIENVTEPDSANGYARELIGSFQVPSSQIFDSVTYDSTNQCFVITNTAQIKFNKATSSWGEIKAFCIYSASTGGNPIFYGTLTGTLPTVSANQSCNIAVGQATLKLY